MSKDIDTHDLFKGDTFRTAFLSELVDFVCEKKPQNLLIRDLEYAKIVRCKDCIHYWKNSPSDDVAVCLASPKDDAFCSEGERTEDVDK